MPIRRKVRPERMIKMRSSRPLRTLRVSTPLEQSVNVSGDGGWGTYLEIAVNLLIDVEQRVIVGIEVILLIDIKCQVVLGVDIILRFSLVAVMR